MDKRATQILTGRSGAVDVHPPVTTAEVTARAGRSAIDSARTLDEADLRKVLRAIAARIDTVLDEKVAAGGASEDPEPADQAWSSVVDERATNDTSASRRQALATTVLRMSADGRVDVDDREVGAIDDAALDASKKTGQEAALEAAHDDGHDAVEGRAESDAEDAAEDTAEGTDEDTAEGAADRHEAPDRPSDVEDRLRAARERLETRRVSAAVARVDGADPRDPRVRPPVWRRTDTRTLIQRLFIGLAIVVASAVVSILIA